MIGCRIRALSFDPANPSRIGPEIYNKHAQASDRCPARGWQPVADTRLGIGPYLFVWITSLGQFRRRRSFGITVHSLKHLWKRRNTMTPRPNVNKHQWNWNSIHDLLSEFPLGRRIFTYFPILSQFSLNGCLVRVNTNKWWTRVYKYLGLRGRRNKNMDFLPYAAYRSCKAHYGYFTFAVDLI